MARGAVLGRLAGRRPRILPKRGGDGQAGPANPGAQAINADHAKEYVVRATHGPLRGNRVGTRWGILWAVSNTRTRGAASPVVFMHGLVIPVRHMLPAAQTQAGG